MIFLIGIGIGGWWIGGLLFALYCFSLALGVVVIGMFVGQWLLGRMGMKTANRLLAMLVGLIIVTLVSRIPIGGKLGLLVGVLFGLGGLVLAAARSRRGAVPAA
jgi:hypothetical protein